MTKIDWSGRLLVPLTWSLLIFANFVTVTQIFDAWFIKSSSKSFEYFPYNWTGAILLFLYEVFTILALVCHVRAVFGDPGTTKSLVSPFQYPSHVLAVNGNRVDSPQKRAPIEVSCPRICKPCGLLWKPPRAHHCRKCELCVFRMDHHCAWIDNCVGIMNQKFFILFLMYSALLCGLQLILLFISVIFWLSKGPFGVLLKPTVLGLFVLLESIVFLYMTADFLTEQLDALYTNSTLVESHQHTHGPRSFWVIVTEVFGKNRLLWLLPTLPVLQLNLAEPVFLDRAVAIQLRHKRKKPLEKKFPDNDGRRDRQVLADIAQQPSNSKIENSSGSATQPSLRMRHKSARARPVVEDPCLPPEKNGMKWPIIRSLHHLQTFDNKTYSRLGSASCHDIPGMDVDSNNDDEEYSRYEEQQFKNVYMRPWEDIGVELDDESRFVQPEDLGGDSSDTSEYSISTFSNTDLD